MRQTLLILLIGGLLSTTPVGATGVAPKPIPPKPAVVAPAPAPATPPPASSASTLPTPPSQEGGGGQVKSGGGPDAASLAAAYLVLQYLVWVICEAENLDVCKAPEFLRGPTDDFFDAARYGTP